VRATQIERAAEDVRIGIEHAFPQLVADDGRRLAAGQILFAAYRKRAAHHRRDAEHREVVQRHCFTVNLRHVVADFELRAIFGKAEQTRKGGAIFGQPLVVAIRPAAGAALRRIEVDELPSGRDRGQTKEQRVDNGKDRRTQTDTGGHDEDGDERCPLAAQTAEGKPEVMQHCAQTAHGAYALTPSSPPVAGRQIGRAHV